MLQIQDQCKTIASTRNFQNLLFQILQIRELFGWRWCKR